MDSAIMLATVLFFLNIFDSEKFMIAKKIMNKTRRKIVCESKLFNTLPREKVAALTKLVNNKIAPRTTTNFLMFNVVEVFL